jgi:hypothetical protein
MGLINWFKRFLARKKFKPSLPAAATASANIAVVAQEETVGLNFKSAIEAHQNWKKRLMSVVDGSSSETLQVEVISRDDQCLLGKWIHSTGAEQFSSLAQFARLKKNHAHFHICAGRVLHLTQTENKEDAILELKEGHYAQASQQVIRDLVAVYTQVTK